jgi:putative transposase
MLHVIGRGNDGRLVFRNRPDFRRFKDTLLRFTRGERLFIHHYALMKTHFHLLAWVEDTEKLATIMKAMLVSYNHYYRKRYGSRGHIWHSRFRSIHVEDESHWLQCGRYIELNPVYAGICGRPDEYMWSSYRFHACGAEDGLVRVKMYGDGSFVWRKGVLNKKYVDFVEGGIDLDYRRLKKMYEIEKFQSAVA